MSTNPFEESLKKEPINALDKHAAKYQYFNRYQTIRSLINNQINTDKSQCNNFASGSINIDYPYPGTNTLNSMTGLQNDHHNTIFTSLHFHLENELCLDFIAAEGKDFILNELANKCSAVNDIHR